MPTLGLSLVGFMDQHQAIQHLRHACVPVDPSDAALIADWNAATASLGAPIANAGHPEILPIPPAYDAHLNVLRTVPSFAHFFPGQSEFKIVEIDPLLAFQFHVDRDRSAHHCQHLTQPPTTADLIELCLPTAIPQIDAQVAVLGTSAVLKSRNLNLRLLHSGILSPNGDAAGVVWGPAPSVVQVVRHNGNCYLSNGFHRCYGARLAGATHVPCLFRDAASPIEFGIREDGSTFSMAILQSANPPTVGHFAQGRAHVVWLRATTRIIHVSWAEYALPDE